MRLRQTVILALAAALVLTASASAGRVPPGNSGAVQYSETLPGAGGEESTPGRAGSKQQSSSGEEAGGRDGAVSGRTAGELRDLGPEGEAALNLAKATAPETGAQAAAHPGSGKDNGGDAAGRKHGGENFSGQGESSGVGEVLGWAVGTSGGGSSPLQPLILAGVLLAAGGYLLGRRRGGPAGPNGTS